MVSSFAITFGTYTITQLKHYTHLLIETNDLIMRIVHNMGFPNSIFNTPHGQILTSNSIR
jgi:hypothetical protein